VNEDLYADSCWPCLTHTENMFLTTSCRTCALTQTAPSATLYSPTETNGTGTRYSFTGVSGHVTPIATSLIETHMSLWTTCDYSMTMTSAEISFQLCPTCLVAPLHLRQATVHYVGNQWIESNPMSLGISSSSPFSQPDNATTCRSLEQLMPIQTWLNKVTIHLCVLKI
jgi:hypothetical protein